MKKMIKILLLLLVVFSTKNIYACISDGRPDKFDITIHHIDEDISKIELYFYQDIRIYEMDDSSDKYDKRNYDKYQDSRKVELMHSYSSQDIKNHTFHIKIDKDELIDQYIIWDMGGEERIQKEAYLVRFYHEDDSYTDIDCGNSSIGYVKNKPVFNKKIKIDYRTNKITKLISFDFIFNNILHNFSATLIYDVILLVILLVIFFIYFYFTKIGYKFNQMNYLIKNKIFILLFIYIQCVIIFGLFESSLVSADSVMLLNFVLLLLSFFYEYYIYSIKLKNHDITRFISYIFLSNCIGFFLYFGYLTSIVYTTTKC